MEDGRETSARGGHHKRAIAVGFGLMAMMVLGRSAALQAGGGQLGALVSPGRLSRPHAQLEGIRGCQNCHEPGQRVTGRRCLTCHKPIAERIAARKGVHRNVTTECVTCHVEHNGLDAELRPFDAKRFDHAGVAAFALDGKHARLATDCAACHKARSFLTARPACASCHVDVHKPTLGQSCATCHSTRVGFKELPDFNHVRSAFPLVGAHRTVECASCHVSRVFRGLKFAACTDCHRDPHRRALGATCTACHTNDTWRTTKVDHRRTAFPLLGRHASVECTACHRQPAARVKPPAGTCAACHADVHRGGFRQDCKACHTESGFENAPFDHSKTTFALSGKHAEIACMACHTTVVTDKVPAARRVADFRGLKTTCAACHADVHDGELGGACESCHSATTFRIPGYTHPRFTAFFAGQHAPVACDKCHARERPTQPTRTGAPIATVRFKNVSTACVSCHRDVHLGQVGAACESCHSVQLAKFALAEFGHERTAFALTGRHQTIQCVECHKRETGPFPAGTGTAVRYKGVSGECRTCHDDVHLGQLGARCETCHSTASFQLSGYKHRSASLVGFFAGRHAVRECQACHKRVTDQFPAGRGTAVRFKVETRCIACHADVHRGALGPNCGNCHRP